MLLMKLKTTKRSASYVGSIEKTCERDDKGERNRRGGRVNSELSLCAARAALFSPSARASPAIETRGQRFNFVRTIGLD